VQAGGPQVREIVTQDVEDVGCFVDAAADEAAEARDIAVRDVARRRSASRCVKRRSGIDYVVTREYFLA
jgi:hypothetical protein